MITLQAVLSPSHKWPPMQINYIPPTPEKWHTFSYYYNQQKHKHMLKERGIHHEWVVYEVRFVFRDNPDERLYVGSGILINRISYLLNKNKNSHTHVNDIWGHAKQYLQKYPKIDKEERDILEIAWTKCDQPVLLELALHILYRPCYPDKNLFPHGYGSVMD